MKWIKGLSYSSYVPEYKILTKATVHESPLNEILDEQKEILAHLQVNEYEKCHFFKSPLSSEKKKIITIEDALQELPVKDGVDLVKYVKNGTIGFIGYYNNIISGFEILTTKE